MYASGDVVVEGASGVGVRVYACVQAMLCTGICITTQCERYTWGLWYIAVDMQNLMHIEPAPCTECSFSSRV